ncbi:MAG: CopD family protein [Rhodoferax sp.]|nr:CopD family protein [Rhodoferax sp.]
MLYLLLKTVHLLAVIVWIGGMVFAHFFLRPAVARLVPEVRLRLMHDVLGRFFKAVLGVVVLSLVSGSWLIGQVARQVVQAGGRFTMPVEWMIMSTLGGAMALIFVYIRWVLYRRLGRAVAASDWADGARALSQIRNWVAVNLVLGVVIVLVTLIGVSH